MIVRGQFSNLFLTTKLPAIDGAIMQSYNAWPEQYTQIFKVSNITTDITQRTGVTGLGLFTQIPENEAVTYDQPFQKFSKTYTPAQWASGFKTSRVAFDDDKFGFIQGQAQELGRSARETVEVRAALIFNNGFTDTGPDGQSLFATTHPNVGGGGTQANRPTAGQDLSVPALESALTDVRTWTDDRGRKRRVEAKTLIIPPALEFLAAKMLSGTMQHDTANNTPNAFRNRVGVAGFTNIFVWQYLTDTDAWFVLGDKMDHALEFIWRERPDTIYDNDFDTRGLKTAMWMRFDVGYADWPGVWGSPGA